MHENFAFRRGQTGIATLRSGSRWKYWSSARLLFREITDLIFLSPKLSNGVTILAGVRSSLRGGSSLHASLIQGVMQSPLTVTGLLGSWCCGVASRFLSLTSGMCFSRCAFRFFDARRILSSVRFCVTGGPLLAFVLRLLDWWLGCFAPSVVTYKPECLALS